MAHFYGEMFGKGETKASRTGTKGTGLSAHIRGWEIGVEVMLWYDHSRGKDMVRVTRTGGSNGRTRKQVVAEFEEGSEV